jgi:hypothetical protein
MRWNITTAPVVFIAAGYIGVFSLAVARQACIHVVLIIFSSTKCVSSAVLSTRFAQGTEEVALSIGRSPYNYDLHTNRLL